MLGEILKKKSFPQNLPKNYKSGYQLKWDFGVIYSEEKPQRRGHCEILIEGSIERVGSEYKLQKERLYELVNNYYLEFGFDFHKKIDGHYLICIHDHLKKITSIYNNRYQATQLYYAETPNSIIFSKNISDFLKVESCDTSPHFGSIRSFVSNGFTMSDQTQLKGVKKLLPSFRIIIPEGEKSYLENHWSEEFDFQRQPIKDLENHLDAYESLYARNIENFLHTHPTKQLGTLLSGGHDTSFTMIQSSKVFDKPIHAFTATFPGWAFDESSFAKNICEKNGGVFHQVPFEPSDLDYIVGLIRANEEPVVGSSLPLHRCAQVASEFVDTMLAGDGGDTLWGEYYPVAEVHRYIKYLPLAMRKLLMSLSQGLVKTFDWERFWELEHVLSLFCQENYYNDFMRRLCTYRHFTDDFQSRLFNPEILSDSDIPRSALEVPFNRDNFSEALIEGKLFNAFYTYQSFHTTKSMEHFGLNFYMPNINQELMSFITRLPENFVNGGTTFHRLTNNKTVNRRFHKLALSRHLKREEIYNRSFDIPWYNILKPRQYVLELLEKRLLQRGWYQESTLKSLFKEFREQRVKDYELLELKHHGYRIFTLLSLEVWTTEYIDGRMTESFNEKIPLEDYLQT